MKTVLLGMFKGTIRTILLEMLDEVEKEVGANAVNWKQKATDVINQKLG